MNKSFILFEGMLQKNNIVLKQLPNGEIECEGYPKELMHVLIVIIQNSIDALIQRDIKNGFIVISTQQTDIENKIKICDNAKGIETEIIERIFEPYFTTKEDNNGSGLGLYMAKKILNESLDGDIEVYNTEMGSCFEISLQRAL